MKMIITFAASKIAREGWRDQNRAGAEHCGEAKFSAVATEQKNSGCDDGDIEPLD
jgi:hypothetical protein